MPPSALESLQEERCDEVGLEPAGLGPLHLLADLPMRRTSMLIVGEGAARSSSVVRCVAVERASTTSVQPGADLGLVAVADRLQEQVAQRIASKTLAQHVEDLAAQRLALDLQLLEQALEDLALARLLGHQVPEVADLGLADAVDAAEPLLEAVGVPGQVVVDHQVGALEVDALAGGVGGDAGSARPRPA